MYPNRSAESERIHLRSFLFSFVKNLIIILDHFKRSICFIRSAIAVVDGLKPRRIFHIASGSSFNIHSAQSISGVRKNGQLIYEYHCAHLHDLSSIYLIENRFIAKAAQIGLFETIDRKFRLLFPLQNGKFNQINCRRPAVELNGASNAVRCSEMASHFLKSL